MHNKWKFWLRGVHRMRDDLLDAIGDDGLDFTPGGDNPACRHLLADLADVEESYIDSLETLTQEFRASDEPEPMDLQQLRERFSYLDTRFGQLYTDWDDDDFARVVTRPGGFEVSRADQFDIYVQAVLIALAKIVVYLRAMGRAVPESARDWIG